MEISKNFFSLYLLLWRMLDTHQKVKMLAIVSTIIVGVGVISVIPIHFGYMITQYESQNVVFISSMFLVTGYAVILMISYLIGEFRFYLLSQLDNDIFRQLIINSYVKILKKRFFFPPEKRKRSFV
jgi:hypothetical protein